MGHKFTIKTDQKSLRSLLDQSLQTPEQQAWLHKFLGYDFRIKYKDGVENVATDALSRVLFMAWSEPKVEFVDKLRVQVAKDAKLQQIMHDCVTDSANN